MIQDSVFLRSIAAVMASFVMMSGPAAAAVVVHSEVHMSADYYGDFGYHGSDVYDRIFDGPADAFGSLRFETRMDQMVDPLNQAFPGYASAAFGPSGLTTVQISGVTSGSNFDYTTFEVNLRQSADILIPSAAGTQFNVYFSFELFDMFAEVWDVYGNATGAAPIKAEIEYDVLLDGRISYNMHAYVWGNRDPPYLQVNCKECTETFESELTGPGDVPRGIEFAPLVYLDSLGTDYELGTVLADGDFDTFNVETRMTARLEVRSMILDAGGRVGFSDPNGVALRGGESIHLEPVPLPAALWTLLSALCGVSVLCRPWTRTDDK